MAKGNAVSFLDPLGIFDSGGSSSSASVSSSVSLDIKGLDKIGVTETVEIKPIEIKPLTVTQNDNITLSPIEIKPLTVNENIDVKPLTVNENIDVKPLTLNETIDLKPLAIDSCQTLRLAPLPETKVCNPYRHQMALSLFGVEFMGMTFNGQTEQEIHSPRRPQVTLRTGYPDRRDGITAKVVGEGIRVRVLDEHDD